ncbi:hypothetical protein [Algoriphagus marinus]|uniref:hypothetical protein n=1 Tax=Algoriphagus marinus TaxID=1925762 RepID=UPI00094BA93D|nr:hypothetical protein [Algoriphagus marinus]
MKFKIAKKSFFFPNDFKVFKSTLSVFFAYMGLMIIGSCIENVDSDPFGRCPSAYKGLAKDIKVLYGPYKDNRYSTENDQVPFDDFTFNLELDIEKSNEANLGSSFPGKAYALSCLEAFNVGNISNIAIILAAPYEGIQSGTDISYLFFVNEKERLSEFRDFSKISRYISLKLEKAPAKNTQLKTKTVLYLRDGTQKIFESTSPTLIPN